MPSAHPRLLADFTQNELFIKSVDGFESDPETEEFLGEDFHTVNSILFKLNSQEEVDEARRTQDVGLIKKILKKRGMGKGVSYCVLYGGSGKKVALILGGISAKEGNDLKDSFLAGLGLDDLLQSIESTWNDKVWSGVSSKGHRITGSFISVLGGYEVFCSSKHKIINYKALGSEAVVQKVAVNWMSNEIRKRGLKTKLIISMHDECLFEAIDEEVEITKQLASEMYPAAAKQLGLTLNWQSAAKVGDNYADCH